MRIAFLCKRRYMGKDVIDDRYARLYEIPYELARAGHDVRGYCLGYQRQAVGTWRHEAAPGTLRWEACALGHAYVPGLIRYRRHLLVRLREFRPDIVIGASDIPHVAWGAWVARRLGCPFVADLYDNFEGFGQARIPGMKAMLRRAVRSADLVTTTSQPLADHVRDAYHARGDVIAMPSTVDKALFHPRDRAACRDALGLPRDAVLVGTAGGLLESRGIGALYAAWRVLAAQRADLHLVLAGPADRHFPPPTGARVHYLGMLPHARTAQLFCALDAGVIYLRDTPFGRYCFPQKAYEMMACHLPYVAAAVGVMPHLLADQPQLLYAQDDVRDLRRALLACFEQPPRVAADVDDWRKVIGGLEPRLVALVERRTKSV